MDPSRFIRSDALAGLCDRWKIERLEVFGSVARGEDDDGSDLDLLVTFANDARWSLLDHIQMEDDFQKAIGRKVDMLTRRSIEASRNEMRRRMILRDARVFYAA